MKLLLVSDEGTVIDEIEDVEAYDLDKLFARADLSAQILNMIRRANKENS